MEVPDYRSFILMSMKELPMEFSKRELCNSHSQTLRRIYPEILRLKVGNFSKQVFLDFSAGFLTTAAVVRL
jgi:hypothetical protein